MAYSAYITEPDYTDLYRGQSINSDAFDRIALRASDELDKLTFNRIRRSGFDSFSSDVQELIKLSVCSLAEALYRIEDATGGGVPAISENVGGYSYSTNEALIRKPLNDARARARQYLMSTNLITTAVSL